MRLNILILTIFLLFINGCANKSQYQIEYEKIKGKAMFEDFDIKMYEKNKSDIKNQEIKEKECLEKAEKDFDDLFDYLFNYELYHENKENCVKKKIENEQGYVSVGYGKKVRKTSSKRGYIDYIEYDKPSLLEETKSYYPNAQIKRYILMFRNRGFLIQTIEFDENKKITKNIDHDEKYKFKPHQLFKLIEKDYKDIDLWSDNTFIHRYTHDKKFYKDYQNLKVIFNEFVENIPLKEDDEPELYWIETVIEKDYEVNPYGKDLKIDLIINAQTGELMIYGKYELEDATDDVGNESIL